MKKVLIPYFLAGSGHLVSAIAIEHYLRAKRPAWEFRLFEPSEALHLDPLDEFYKRYWNIILKRTILSTVVFFLADHIFSFITLAVNRHVTRASTPAMKKFLIEYEPDLVITTHWGCGHLVAGAMKAGAPVCPLFVTRNDLGGAYKLQRVNCDRIIVMSPEAMRAFKRLGEPERKILQVNPVVRPEFMNCAAKSKNKEGISLLLASGGEGIGKIQKTTAMILETTDEVGGSVTIDILTGRNKELRDELLVELRDSRITVHGYREDVHNLMAQTDIVVGKCGANSTMETVMSGKPFLITHVGAPSEYPNKTYILKRGYGWYAKNSRSLKKIIRKILVDDEEIASKVQNLKRRPIINGAAEIADIVIRTVEEKVEENRKTGGRTEAPSEDSSKIDHKSNM